MEPDHGPATAAPPPPAPKRLERAWLTAALALAALLGNAFGLPLAFGVDFLFGSIAVMLALAWLGTRAGLVVALVGGADTWLLWGHPYSLFIFLAEAAAVGWQRERACRRGLAPPPLAVSAALYWLLLGVPLAVLAHRVVLGMDWTPTLLIALKQAQNGILNAALADLVLVVGALVNRRKSALPLAQPLFGVLLAAMLLPTLLVNAWENWDLKARLETAQAERLRLFGELGVRQLLAQLSDPGADPAALAAQLQVMRAALAENLPAPADPQLRLERGPARVAAARVAASLYWDPGASPPPGQVIATAVPGLSLISPSGRYSSRVAWWHQVRYRLEVPDRTVPNAAGALSLDWRLVIEWSAAPVIDQIQGAAARLLVLLLAVTLLGLLVAGRLSQRIMQPLRQLVQGARALPSAIREDRALPAPRPGLLMETGELADAATVMAESLAASFRALHEERDRRAAVNLELYRQEGRYRLVAENIEDLIIRVDAQGRFKYVSPSYCRTFGRTESELIGTAELPAIHPDDEAATTAAVASLLQPPHTFTIEQRNRTVRGWRWFQWSDQAVLDSQGRVIGIVAVGRDVTDRKVAEQELRESEQRERAARLTLERTQESLLKAQAIARLGSWEFDLRTEHLSWSPETFRIFGQDPERFEPSYAGMLAAIHPEDQVLLDRVYRESVANHAPYELVHRLLLPDGCIKWVHERGETDYAADGTPLTSRGTTQDITERTVAELALAEERRRLANVITATRVATWEWDLPTGTGTINDRWAQIIGYRLDEFAPLNVQTWMDLTHPDDLKQAISLAKRHVTGELEGYECELRMRHKDGHWVWVLSQGRVVDWDATGAPRLMSGISQDITERRLAQERLKESEEALIDYNAQLEKLVDVISLPLPPAEQVSRLLWLGCHSLGGHAVVLAMTDEAHGHHVLFAARDDALGVSPPELDRSLLHEALAHLGSPRVVEPEQLPGAVIAAGFHSGITMAFECRCPDDQIDTLVLSLWGLEPSLNLSGPGQQIIRLIAQRIAAVRYQEQVQHDLVAAKGRETIGHLASGISHDFNNLLGVIDANIYYIEGRVRALAPTDPQLRQVFDETQSALGQAKVITSGMLSLSRAGGVPLELVDLGPAVAELGRILHQVFPAAIELRIAVAPGLTVWSNRAFLQSALLNLALNARDAMPEGGRLSIEAQLIDADAPVALAVGRLPSMDCIALRVTDNGSGIAPDLLTRIFDPLFSTKAKRRGHGLGLFMVQEFVTRSGAGLTVESQLGRGTCFSLLLSRAAPATPTGGLSELAAPGLLADVSSAHGAAALTGLRVLVVDDDPRVREAVGRLLTLDGARLGQAEHGQACLELLERDGAFDLVLSDIAMPVLDGVQLVQRLAQQRPGLPVILMTGQKDALDALEELPEWPTVLRKPLDPAVLRAAILAKLGARSRPESAAQQ
ncbi:PAS domain-containing protein [uncultured Thiodictyon sp.]|uniref:PAS domain-containing protein n=1 Tax=uncultured Thiodictyon sp. TaxID=1846217 RepID=UPI0025F9CF2F|nr:PAS domain-containing protein [uncultured Thiodictyon sp.]